MHINSQLLFLVFSWGIWGLLALVLWIWALADIIRRNFRNSNTKLIWIIIVILIPFLGSVLYLVLGRNQK
jgi:Phospholipase_D-nuclease N-terminal